MTKSTRTIATMKPTENMATVLEIIFATYANCLRNQYAEKTIRNAEVFKSAVAEFSRRKLIVLVNAKSAIPLEVPDFLGHQIKRTKHFPVWMPTKMMGNP